MDHQFIVTAKTRTRKQVPQTTLREVQSLEDLYGLQYFDTDIPYVLARNKIFTEKVYFPIKCITLRKK